MSNGGKQFANPANAPGLVKCFIQCLSQRVNWRNPWGGRRSLVFAVAFSPDGRYLASGALFGDIDLWDTTTWELARTVKSKKNRYSNLAFSPDGRLLAVGASNNQIQLWDVDTLAPVGQLDGGLGRIEAVAFSPDGELLASGSSDGGVQLWGVAALLLSDE